MSLLNNKIILGSMLKYALVIGLCLFSVLPASAQKIAVKTNLLYDLTSTLNAGVEFRCSDARTFQLAVNYNPWEFGNNRKMKHFLLQPEYRRWLEGAFMGGYVGAQAHYGVFNWGGMLPWGFKNGDMFGMENNQIKNNRYQGHLIGLGASCGYQWMLGARWNLEASIALGYARLNYKRYGSGKGAWLIEKSHCNYWGPTQAGVSLVYFIR